MLPPFTMNAWLRFDGIRRAISGAGPHSVLEIGVGEGASATWIAPRFDYLGVEQDDRSRALAQARLGRVGRGRIVADLDDVPDARFDMVCAFEVLEHIADDVAALSEWRARLNAGGHALLSVPAHADQFGPHDELVGHYRRYDRDELVVKLEKAGFAVVRLTSHGVGLGQVLEWGRNQLARRRELAPTLEQRTAASGRLLQPHSAVSLAACAALAAPFRVLQAPFASRDLGTGYVALARMLP
ncbi:MAG: class I SAM-dependent methyltransferase [Actinomycetota bacterium]|nr:class I SAM-dependent methyltransferase [Actinomycetota bacterium]